MKTYCDERLVSRRKHFAVAFGAGAALLLASFANFLTHNSYPYFRLEVGIIIVGMLVIAAVMAAWYVPQRQLGRSFLEGLLAAFFIDLNTDSGWLILAVGFAVFCLTGWKRISLLAPMAMIGSVILLTTILGIGGRPAWIESVDREVRELPASAKPAIIHLILDEHIGIEGLTAEGPSASREARELSDFYQSSGFTVYGGAYSQHYHTANAIPYMLNYGSRLGESSRKSGVRTGPTEHLQLLQKAGYRINILQSEYADICSGATFAKCTTYAQSGLGATLAVPLSSTERAQLILYKSLKLSKILRASIAIWNQAAINLRQLAPAFPTFDPTPSHSSSVGALEALANLEADLKQARPGNVYFAHILLPHHPYVVGSSCNYLPWPWLTLTSSASIASKRAAYLNQLRCTRSKVDGLLDALSRSPAHLNNVVIIHGDHGSRIGRLNPYNQASGRFDTDELITNFSTFFAVRTSVPQPGYLTDRAPVAWLLGEFAKSGFDSPPLPPTRKSHLVFLADGNWKPVRTVPMPGWWAKGLDRPVNGQ